MKILCLGNNTEDTDAKTRKLASNSLAECHGLLSELDGQPLDTTQLGWYHSSVYDIEYRVLVKLAAEFDSVIMLDQPKKQYSHPDAFYKTVSLIKDLPNGKFLDPGYATDIVFFEDLVKINKSFCIFPFIELLTNQRADGYTTVCCRSNTPVAHVSELTDWKNNKSYKEIRDKMINGVRVPEHCSSCYKLEDKNILSPREQETVEWANGLNLKSLDDLKKITHPTYYEIRPSNVCNLQCRMCNPTSSHLIGKEYKKINLISKIPSKERSDFSIVNFNNLKKLYIAGGEPTAMPEFYEFLDHCIQQKQTDFEFLINTNATKLNNRFKKQLKNFSNLQFVVSLDGAGPLHHYIRWPSQWDTIVENMQYLRKNNHIISTNTTVSIYNVVGLHKLLKFFDDEFPGMLVHVQSCVSNDDMLNPFNFPNTKLALEQLLPIQNLNCYRNDRLLKSYIDGIIAHYQANTEADLEKLKLFFEFNDKLDQSRNIRLADYIPELEQARTLI
jgi:sulfatase maturation enzyme AslB (radical SAM superfamily)